MEKDEDKKGPEGPAPPENGREFKDSLHKLVKDAEDAGVDTTKEMALAGFRGLLRFGNRVLAELEGETEKPKPKRKKKPSE